MWKRCGKSAFLVLKQKNVEVDYSICRIGHILDRSEPQSLGKLEDPVKKHMVSIKQPLSGVVKKNPQPFLCLKYKNFRI